MNKNFRATIAGMLGLVVLVLSLTLPGMAEAGIYNSSDEVTYKEYWISHQQFKGGCLPDGSPEKPFGNSFYSEPGPKCTVVMSFELPDDFTNAAKVEIYLDLWRNYDSQAARFKLNNSPTVYAPPVGSDWSRSAYVGEIPKSELNVGTNTITFTGDKLYHIHDVAFRIYHDGANPLVPGNGSDVTPPNGTLDSIEDDNGAVAPSAGGTLQVNQDKIKLTATVSADTKLVEFHAWYEGYDEDDDGVFRDWHNLGRNNWFPGGTDVANNGGLGGVINNVGTVKPNNGTASFTWNTTNIANQARIRFKIRLIDENGNVREAAGGESANFRMMRNNAVLGFIIPGFTDFGLHMSGSRPDTVAYDFKLPANINDFDKATVLGNYWRNPKFSINGTNPTSANSGDMWILGVQGTNAAAFVPGNNRIIYSWVSGQGAFVEEPGPLFMFRRTPAGGDNQPPTVSNRTPAPGATNVSAMEPLKANISDAPFGVDFTTVNFKVNGVNVSDKIKLDGVSSDYVMSYKPAAGWDYSTTYNISIEACDLIGNCMPPVTYSFTTEAPDVTPPQISNVVVTPRPNGAQITWDTNEPATSRIDYGTTNSYELGFVEDTALTTSHNLDIQGLVPDTTYFFQITSKDAQDNPAKKSDSFVTAVYPDVQSDDFNYCTLDPMWQFINPQGDASLELNGTQAIINLPAGVLHGWGGGRPPRLMQLANDADFTIQVKFDSTVNQLTQMQGILVEQSAQTYLYIGFEYVTDPGTGLPTLSQYARFIKDGNAVKGARKFITDISNTAPIWAQLVRTGDSWEWSYSADGVNWKKASQAYTFDMTVLGAGVYAGNTPEGAGGIPAYSAVIDYFFNAASPIVPEDGNLNSLTLTPSGNGTTAKTPDKANYACGEEVTITATPALGWFLEGWSGDFTGTNLTETVVMDNAKTITANFAATPYTVTANVVNNGTGSPTNAVTKSPDQPTYVYNDLVTLTAVPQAGWQFVGWSGDLSGTELVKQVTVQSNIEATATFAPITYTLGVTVDSSGAGIGGTATAAPSKATYQYGEVVTLTATPNPGWTFTGWTGAVTSNELETELVITGNAQVVAHFVQNQYELTIDVVSVGGTDGGTVAANPPKATYVYGEMVSLVAKPNPGWEFQGWSGAASGSELNKTITILGDTAVTATFAQETYTLDVTITGQGAVDIAPDKASYVYGEKVTLTANPATNMYFGGWSGDLVSGQNPVEITIVGDMEIVAKFTDNAPPQVDPIPNKGTKLGRELTFTVTATDPTGEEITLSAVNLPAGAKFTDHGDGTGTFEWTPGLGDNGSHVVTFIASDFVGTGSATTTISVSGYGLALPAIVRP